MTTFLPTIPPTREVWEKDIQRAQTALAPWVRTAPDGSQYLDPEATPGPLAKIYGELLSLGYANGWMP